jgi:hypothetical protein
MGSRYMQEEYGDKLEDWPPFAAPRVIAKVMHCFEEWTGRGEARTEYSFLSEFTHPNMPALSHYYTMEAEEGSFGLLRFVDPPRQSEAAPWPHIGISVTGCLHFTLRLLQFTGEQQVAPLIENILIEYSKQ